MPRSRRSVGDEAEAWAVDYLLSLGYTIVTRNFTIRGGEVDVIAMDGETIVFVEVKFRTADRPEDSLTARKVERLRAAARAYLRQMGVDGHEHRFDLVAIEGTNLRHHQRLELG